MSPVQFTQQQSREDIEDRLGGWCCVAIGLILYCCFFIPISNYLWNSYEESSCFVVNNRVIESQTCWKCQSEPVFYAVWVIDVHRSTRSQPTRYLADIRQKFDRYYEAYEAVLTNYVVSTDPYQFDQLISIVLEWHSTTLLCVLKR